MDRQAKKELKIGMKASIVQKATPETVESYAKVSGDYNRIHLDEEYAKDTAFGRCIAHGLFCQGMISNVIGNILPGPGSIFISESICYRRPVYIDNEIVCEVEVAKLLEKGKVELAFQCVKKGEESEVVVDGTALVKID